MTWKTGLSSGRPNHGAFDHDPGAHIFPERDQQLVALWKYVSAGVVIEGAMIRPA